MERFQFYGFRPDIYLKQKAYRALEFVLEKAPSEAKVLAQLRKERDGFVCTLEIVSDSCPVFVEVKHRVASAAIDKAEISALRRLSRWRGNRYLLVEKYSSREPLRIAK